MSLSARHRRDGLLTGSSASSPAAESGTGGPRRLVPAVPAGGGAAPATRRGGSLRDTGAGRAKLRLASELVLLPDPYRQDRGGEDTNFTLSLLVRSVLVRHKEERRQINEQLPRDGI